MVCSFLLQVFSEQLEMTAYKKSVITTKDGVLSLAQPYGSLIMIQEQLQLIVHV